MANHQILGKRDMLIPNRLLLTCINQISHSINPVQAKMTDKRFCYAPHMSGPKTDPNCSRRAFLASAAATGVIATTNLKSAIPPSLNRVQGTKKYLKAVKYGMIGVGSSVLEKFQAIKELGFDGVELDSPNGLKLDEVLAARDQTNLPIHGVVDSAHWGKPFSHPNATVRAEGLLALQTAIRDCKSYGGSTVLVVPAVVTKEISYAKAWQRSQKEIAKALPLAEELGIKIAFENVWNNFLLSPLEMAQYIDSFKSKMVGAYLDVGNLVRYAWPEHWVEVLQSRILKIDVKGYSRKLQNEKGPWKGFQVPIGEGDCDWPTILTHLQKVGFEGWFTAEVGGGDKKRLEDIAAAMDRIMASP